MRPLAVCLHSAFSFSCRTLGTLVAILLGIGALVAYAGWSGRGNGGGNQQPVAGVNGQQNGGTQQPGAEGGDNTTPSAVTEEAGKGTQQPERGPPGAPAQNSRPVGSLRLQEPSSTSWTLL